MDRYLELSPTSYLTILDCYDSAVSGSLVFSYCDDVAKLYTEIYGKIDDPSIKKQILTRLLILGVSHNRGYVMRTFCNLLEQIKDHSIAMVARDVIRENKEDIAYIKQTDLLTNKKFLTIILNEILLI